MRKRIENPGTAEDYVDGLRGKGDARWHNSTADEHPPVTSRPRPIRPIKDVDTRLSTPVKWLVAGAIFMGGMCVHAVAFKPDVDGMVNAEVARRAEHSTAQQAPPPAPETQVVTKPTLTNECKRALDGMDRVLKNASTMASGTDQQLDIFTEARQAIVLKDWRKINDLEVRQRALESKLSKDKVPAALAYSAIQKDLKACRSQPSSR